MEWLKFPRDSGFSILQGNLTAFLSKRFIPDLTILNESTSLKYKIDLITALIYINNIATDGNFKFLLNLDILEHTVRVHPPLCVSKKYKTRLYSQSLIGTAAKDSFYLSFSVGFYNLSAISSVRDQVKYIIYQCYGQTRFAHFAELNSGCFTKIY